jgi:glycosyltransferase involved in cell wall biosynthesis
MTVHYQKLTRRPVFCIPNGVAKSERRPPDLIHDMGLCGDDYIFFAARFVPEKGAHYLIDAFKQIDTNKKLVLAGDGSYGDAYAQQLKAQAGERILFPGFVQGPLLEELLSNAYLYVLPSEIEGLSTGLLEAMSYGNCVLVSDIEENREVIGQAGCTFRSANVDDLKTKLCELLENDAIVKQYRLRAKEHISTHFDWETITDQVEALYKSTGIKT